MTVFLPLYLPTTFLYRAQVKMFVEGLFHLNNNIPAFKEHLRDFLVQIKVCHTHGYTCVHMREKIQLGLAIETVCYSAHVRISLRLS